MPSAIKNHKIIILAAGASKRMKSKIPKFLHSISGKTLVQHVTDAAAGSGTDAQVAIVVGNAANEVRQSLKGDAAFFTQHELLGTGHAVMAAEEFFAGSGDSSVVVLFGDTPLIKAETIGNLIKYHESSNNDFTIISALIDNPDGYGRIIRKNNEFYKIVEHKDANAQELAVREINTGVICFKACELEKSLHFLRNDNGQNEYYITDVPEIMLRNGLKGGIMTAPYFEEFLGINNKIQLAAAAAVMRRRINEEHMSNGVTIIDPERTLIDCSVKIGADTEIYPGTILQGETIIGEDCKIYASRLNNMTIGNSVTIDNSTAIDSSIGDFTTVGPYAYIRLGSQIGSHVKIGDFVEIKNSVIDNNTKMSHLTYIGDTDAGKNINFGCGTITVNYDGKNKHRTVVGDNAFIGCNTNLISPVSIGESAYIAAGSTITDNVPKESLAIARSRQIIKNDWVDKRNQKG